jgi:hypothetical protein
MAMTMPTTMSELAMTRIERSGPSMACLASEAHHADGHGAGDDVEQHARLEILARGWASCGGDHA